MGKELGVSINHALGDWCFGKQPNGKHEKSSSDAPAPGTIQGLVPPRLVRGCGQCEGQLGNVFCTQCKETFCWTCASSIHQRGKMAYHTGLDLLADKEVLISLRTTSVPESNLGRHFDSREPASSPSPERDVRSSAASKAIATNSVDQEAETSVWSLESPRAGRLTFNGNSSTGSIGLPNRHDIVQRSAKDLKHEVQSGLAAHLSRLRSLTRGIAEERDLEATPMVDFERGPSKLRRQPKLIKAELSMDNVGANGKPKSGPLPKQIVSSRKTTTYVRMDDEEVAMPRLVDSNTKTTPSGVGETQMLASMVIELEHKLQAAWLALDASEACQDTANLQEPSASQRGIVTELKNRLDIAQATKEQCDRQNAEEQRQLQLELCRLKMEAQTATDLQHQLDVAQALKEHSENKYAEEQRQMQHELAQFKLEVHSAQTGASSASASAANGLHKQQTFVEEETRQMEKERMHMSSRLTQLEERIENLNAMREKERLSSSETIEGLRAELRKWKVEAERARNDGSNSVLSIKDLQLQNGLVHEEKQQLEQERGRLSSTIAQLEKQIQQSVAARNEDGQTFTLAVEQMQTELLRLRDTTEDAQMKASRLAITANRFKLEQTLEVGEAQRLATKASDLQNRLASVQSELEAAEQSREEKRNEMFILQDRSDKAQIRTAQLTSLVQDLESQLGNANSALSEADRVVRRSRSHSTCFESEVDALRTEAKQSEDLLQAARFASNEELKALRVKLDDSFSDSDSLRRLVEDLKQQLRDSQTRVLDKQSHDGDLCSMRTDLQEAHQQVAHIRQQSEDDQRRYTSLKTEFEALQVHSSEMKHSEQQIGESLAKSKLELDKACQNESRYALELEEMRSCAEVAEQKSAEMANLQSQYVDLQRQAQHETTLEHELARFKALEKSQEVAVDQYEHVECQAREWQLKLKTTEEQTLIQVMKMSEEIESCRAEVARTTANANEVHEELHERYEHVEDEARDLHVKFENSEVQAQIESEQLSREVETYRVEAARARSDESQINSDLQATMQDLLQARVDAEKARKELDKLTSAPTARLQKLQDREVQDEVSKFEQARSESNTLASELQYANEDLQSAKAQLASADQIREEFEVVRIELEESRAECKSKDVLAEGVNRDVPLDAHEELESIKNEREKLRASFKESRADVRRLKRENEELQKQLNMQGGDEPRIGDPNQRVIQSELAELRVETERKDSELAEASSEVHDLQQKLREARLETRKAQEQAGLVGRRSERRDRRSVIQAAERPADDGHLKDLPETSKASDSVTWC